MSILFEVANGIAQITLNRPDKKNAMLLSMRDELAALAERINDDNDIRVVILTGAGTDFCAGADISEMAKDGISGSLLKARHMNKAITGVAAIEKPTIAAVRGVALGMGLSMALACDFVVAGESLRMGCVQRKIGLSPDAGNVWYLGRFLGVARAKELVYSARMFGAEEALDWNLVSRVVADDQIVATAEALAADFVNAPSLALGAAKKMFDMAQSMNLHEFMELEGSLVPLLAQSEDFKEGTKAFLEKRAPKFVGN
jgi:2-(1,2-epoxy-1,2-dihydrophenyl)acetyl-CoA isomerase